MTLRAAATIISRRGAVVPRANHWVTDKEMPSVMGKVSQTGDARSATDLGDEHRGDDAQFLEETDLQLDRADGVGGTGRLRASAGLTA